MVSKANRGVVPRAVWQHFIFPSSAQSSPGNLTFRQAVLEGLSQGLVHKSLPRFLGRSLYIEQLEMIAKHVPRDRIHVEISEDIRETLNYSRIFRFLGASVDGDPRPEDYASGGVAHVTQHLCAAGTQACKDAADMPADIKELLVEFYRPYNERLRAWLGHTAAAGQGLKWWCVALCRRCCCCSLSPSAGGPVQGMIIE